VVTPTWVQHAPERRLSPGMAPELAGSGVRIVWHYHVGSETLTDEKSARVRWFLAENLLYVDAQLTTFSEFALPQVPAPGQFSWAGMALVAVAQLPVLIFRVRGHGCSGLYGRSDDLRTDRQAGGCRRRGATIGLTAAVGYAGLPIGPVVIKQVASLPQLLTGRRLVRGQFGRTVVVILPTLPTVTAAVTTSRSGMADTCRSRHRSRRSVPIYSGSHGLRAKHRCLDTDLDGARVRCNHCGGNYSSVRSLTFHDQE
jgi:hypothetical protein